MRPFSITLGKQFMEKRLYTTFNPHYDFWFRR